MNTEHVQSGVLGFYTTFNDVPWDAAIQHARQIDVAVYYFDSWVNSHRAALVDFFSRGGSVRLFLPNTSSSDRSLVNGIQALFDEHSRDEVRRKIANTGLRFAAAQQEAPFRHGRLDIFYLDRPARYSAVRFDRSELYLSVYENYREGHIGSSVIVLDTQIESTLRAYWDKEFAGMQENGIPVQVSELRQQEG